MFRTSLIIAILLLAAGWALAAEEPAVVDPPAEEDVEAPDEDAGEEEGDALSEKAKAFQAESERQRLEAVAQAKAEIKKLKTDLSKMRKTKRSTSTLSLKAATKGAKTDIAWAEARIERLEKNDPPFRALMVRPLKVGSIGRLPYLREGWTRHVVDDSNVVIEVPIALEEVPRARISQSRTLSRGGSHYKEIRKKLWFRGIDASELIDNQKTDLPDVYEITGTERSRYGKIFVLEPVDLVELLGDDEDADDADADTDEESD